MDVQLDDGIWHQIVFKDPVEDHLIGRNLEQFLNMGETPLGYTEPGQALGHTGDTPMAEAILEGALKHETLSDSALAAIVKHVRQHPAVWKIINPIVTEQDFKSAFKCVPEKTASSFSTIARHAPKVQKMGWLVFNQRFVWR
jgi:hypothetical protein